MINPSRASEWPCPRGSSTWRSRKRPVSSNPSSRSCSDQQFCSSPVARRNGGSGKSRSRQGSPACRDTAPPEKWPELLFWGNFVGSDISHKIVTKPAHCGWTHYAPNSESDYDWTNPRYVETDIEDWKPDGGGKTQKMNADRWGRDPIKWRIYWMQAIPGLDHGLTYKGKKLRNWWSFVAEWDRAMKEKWTLVLP